MSNGARERIIASATAQFARDGVRASGVNAIIAASGVAKATFYRHFKSKDELVLAWLEANFGTRVDEMLAAAEASASTPAERLDVIFDDLTERLVKPDFAGFPFIDAAMDLPDAAGPVRDLVHRQLADTRALLHELTAAAGTANPTVAAAELQLLLLGLMVRVRAEPEARVEAGRIARNAARRLVATPGGSHTSSASPPGL